MSEQPEKNSGVSLTAEGEGQREIERLRQQLADVRREYEDLRRQEEELRRQKEEERRQKEDEMVEKEEERRQIEELQRQSPTQLFTYLSLVDDYLFRSLNVESDTSKTSTPGTTDVSGRFYPKHFFAWTDFDTLHADLFMQLETTLGSHALFPSRNALQALCEDSSPLVSDEADLRPFLRNAVETPASLIVTRYLSVTRYLDATRHPKLSSFKFRNSSYGENLRDLGIDIADAEGARGRPKKRPPLSIKMIGNPDRWGFATHLSEQEVYTHVLVGEYKAAHKLQAKKLQAVLAQSPEDNFFALAVQEEEQTDEDNLEAATTSAKTKTTARDGRVSVARVLCQAYHYMISSGLEYGYVASGEGLVLLRVPEDDANTLYYFWCDFAPPVGGDVSRQDSMPVRPPQDTAAAYLSSLALLGLRSPKRPAAWIKTREKDLSRWPQLRQKVAPEDIPRLVLRGRRGEGEEGEEEGERRREKENGGRSPRKRRHSPDANEEGTEDVNKKKSIKADGAGHGLLPFCTQACLLGLKRRQPMDDACPNVHLHRAVRVGLQGKKQPGREDSHPLTAKQLCARLEKQAETDEAVYMRSLETSKLYGRFGVLVRVTVAGFGYTMVAKGTAHAYYGVLDHELAIHDKLAAVQGRLVPVCLGLIELPDTFDPGPRCTPLDQLLLLSFAGLDLAHISAIPYNVDIQDELDRTTRELQMLGLRNEDVRKNNCAWNAEVQRVMHFDFDQAEFRAKVNAAAASSATRSPLQAKRNWNATVTPLS
ncbi:hypothetical protein SEPCBS57363_006543 [Sporothrix epigloea]|uniref:Metalloprotease m41 n=1 Tax=Sporothrix epigloea TaxID=1892477 RepID=A0ABP0E7V8_9PEZI